MKQFVLTTALFAFTAVNTADAADLNQFIAFGDSTLDTGYFRYHTTGSAAGDRIIADAVALGATGG